jgi:hypothetical protein
VEDIKTLQGIKTRALGDPKAFAEAVVAGKVGTRREGLFDPIGLEEDEEENTNGDEEEEVDWEENGSGVGVRGRNDGANVDPNGDTIMTSPSHSMSQPQPPIHPPILPPNYSRPEPASATTTTTISPTSIPSQPQPPSTQPWPLLPTPQTIVRTPPINWAQYGIVGASLDQLHNDQIAHPPVGVPARLGAEGQTMPLEKGQAMPAEEGRRHEGLGVAAAYVPGRDKIVRDGRKGKR